MAATDHRHREDAAREQALRKPLVSCLVAGLIASVCCGGQIIFASVGLGALYGDLGLSRYVPQVLGLGALSIVAINSYVFSGTAQGHAASGIGTDRLRRQMFTSAAIGLTAIVASFVLLEWLRHAVQAAEHFMTRPEYAQVLIPGVPNIRLLLCPPERCPGADPPVVGGGARWR